MLFWHQRSGLDASAVDVFGMGSGLGISFADLTITSVDGNAQIATHGIPLALALSV
ncbi:MAG: hypothetical protein HC890_17435 [Chloroflexaceae bacterium]|nr:hypothetical protein [Chloroflexaceae bacterium]